MSVVAIAWPQCGAVELQQQLRRPVALALTSDGQWLFTANRDSGSISVLDTSARSVAEEIEVEGQLSDLVVLDDEHLLVLDERNHQLVLLAGGNSNWKVASRLDVARFPVRLSVDRETHRCFISSLWSQTVTTVNLPDFACKPEPRLHIAATRQLPFEPREMCFVAGGNRLIVAGSFSNTLAVFDTASLELVATKHIPGHNIRGLAISSDGKRLLVAQQDLNPHSRSTRDDVHWGNMISNLLVSLFLDDLYDPEANVLRRRVAFHLGEPGRAAGDPGPIQVGPTGNLVVVVSGVNEIAVGRDRGNYGLRRIPVGLRPSAAISTADGHVFVSDMFSDSVSIVDLADTKMIDRLSLGPQPELSPAEIGEMLFYDSRLSHDGWMSCHSCHTDGHSSSQLNDNLSDGSFGSPKRVLSLLGVEQTGPWAWNGEMKTLEQQVASSIQNTMQGVAPTEEQIAALVAYLKTLASPPVLPERAESRNSAEIIRGKDLFQSLDCNSCHTPPTYTSPRAYDVGLIDSAGIKEFNPPSLRAVGRRKALFHDARETSLADVFIKHKHQLNRQLLPNELNALLHFLRSL